MKKTRLRSYAQLIAKMGCNVQKGQDVFLTCGIEQPEFTAMVVDELYKAGARKVFVDMSYQPLEKIHVRGRSVKSLGTVESFEEEKLKYMAEKLPIRLFLTSEDPDGLKGMNTTKMVKGQQARYPGMPSRASTSGASPVFPALPGPRKSSPANPRAVPSKNSGKPSFTPPVWMTIPSPHGKPTTRICMTAAPI